VVGFRDGGGEVGPGAEASGGVEGPSEGGAALSLGPDQIVGVVPDGGVAAGIAGIGGGQGGDAPVGVVGDPVSLPMVVRRSAMS
jgi:hypothetical protein